MSARDALIGDATSLLGEAGFTVSRRCNIRPKSFDVVARRGSEVVLVKVLVNIDSFDGATASEMRLLAHYLDASSLLLGRKSSDHELEDGVLYLRHGVPAINLATAYDYFVEAVPPLVYMAPGGLYANLDGDMLAELRRRGDRSLGQIAKEVGVSRRSVSKYEDGMDASLDVAIKLEQLFDEPLISPIDVLDHDDVEEGPGLGEADADVGEEERAVFRLLGSAGFTVHPTRKAPFRALTHSRADADDTVLTGTTRYSEDVVKRAKLMSSISRVARTRSVYIVDDSPRRDSIDDTVIIGIDELRDIEGTDELDEVYKEKSPS